MPRRNNRRRFQKPVVVRELPPVTDTDEMARLLVAAGKASPIILGPLMRPWTNREETTR